MKTFWWMSSEAHAEIAQNQKIILRPFVLYGIILTASLKNILQSFPFSFWMRFGNVFLSYISHIMSVSQLGLLTGKSWSVFCVLCKNDKYENQRNNLASKKQIISMLVTAYFWTIILYVGPSLKTKFADIILVVSLIFTLCFEG